MPKSADLASRLAGEGRLSQYSSAQTLGSMSRALRVNPGIRLGIEVPYASIRRGDLGLVTQMPDEGFLPYEPGAAIRAIGIGTRLIDEDDLGPRIKTWLRKTQESPDVGPVFLRSSFDYVVVGPYAARVGSRDKLYLTDSHTTAGSTGARHVASSGAGNKAYLYLTDDTTDFSDEGWLVIRKTFSEALGASLSVIGPAGGSVAAKFHVGTSRVHYLLGGLGTGGSDFGWYTPAAAGIAAITQDDALLAYFHHATTPWVWLNAGTLAKGLTISTTRPTSFDSAYLLKLGNAGGPQNARMLIDGGSTGASQAGLDFVVDQGGGGGDVAYSLQDVNDLGVAGGNWIGITRAGIAAQSWGDGFTRIRTLLQMLPNAAAAVSPIRFYESDGTNYVALKPASAIAADFDLTLPAALPGGANYLMVGSAAGVLSFLDGGTLFSVLGHTHTLADITDEGALAALNTVGTAQIDNDAVTYAKMQNVSATDKLLGRSTAGAGNVEEIACTAFARTLLDDATAAAARTTLAAAAAVHTHVEADITDLVHTDATAIHDNVASEISAVTEKVTPVDGDFLLIEDSAAANAKKRIQIGNLPSAGGGQTIVLDLEDGNTVGSTAVETTVFSFALPAATVAVDAQQLRLRFLINLRAGGGANPVGVLRIKFGGTTTTITTPIVMSGDEGFLTCDVVFCRTSATTGSIQVTRWGDEDIGYVWQNYTNKLQTGFNGADYDDDFAVTWANAQTVEVTWDWDFNPSVNPSVELHHAVLEHMNV